MFAGDMVLLAEIEENGQKYAMLNEELMKLNMKICKVKTKSMTISTTNKAHHIRIMGNYQLQQRP